jgi:outer membrane immunogenic protein
MKRRFLLALAGAVFALTSGGANAADIPLKAPRPPIITAFSWTGFYVGANAGYMWGSSNWTGGAGAFSISPKGWMGGGTLGYNFQTGVWVWGLETDLDYVDLNGTNVSAACASCSIRDTWFGTLRGRVGYAWDRSMWFFTGGLAYGNVKLSTPGGTTSNTKTGWTIGTGFEYAFSGPWSAKLEYLYADLGTATCSAATCGLATDAQVSFKANMVRAGINYRF